MANYEIEHKECPTHGKTKFIRKGTSHLVHGILSLLTVGLWLPIWFIAANGKIGGWKCEQCGQKPVDYKNEYYIVAGLAVIILISMYSITS